MPNYPVVERTAVIETVQPLQLTTCARFVGPPEFLPPTTKLLVSRQACYPVWMDYTILPTVPFVHSVTWPLITDSGSVAAEVRPVAPNIYATSIGANVGSIYTPAITYSGSTQTNGLFYGIIGTKSHSEQFIYFPNNTTLHVIVTLGTLSTGGANAVVTLECDDGTQFNVTVTATSGTNGMYGSIYRSGGPHWSRPVSVAPNVSYAGGVFGTISCVVTSSLAGQVTWNPATTLTVNPGTLTINSSTVMTLNLPVGVNPELRNAGIPFANTRVGGLSLRGINTTKLMNREGSINWGRVPPSIDPFTLTEPGLSMLPENDRRQFSISEGFYTYVAPGQELLSFKDYRVSEFASTSSGGPSIFPNTVAIPAYDLSTQAYTHVGFILDPDTGTSFAITVATHLEFRTPSQLFPSMVCPLPLEALHKAVLQMDRIGYFFPNPDLNYLRSALRGSAPAKNGVRPPRVLALPSPPRVRPQQQQTNRSRSSWRQNRPASQPPKRPQPRQPDSQPKNKGGLSIFLATRGKKMGLK